MNKIEFIQKVYDLSSFQRQLQKITINSVSGIFINLKRNQNEEELLKEIDWNNLLSCASILAQSDIFEHLDSSLRIAQSILDSTLTSESQKIAAAIILEKLTNKPAISLAISRNYLQEDFRKNIPVPLLMNISKINIAHSILAGRDIIELNRFQKQVFDTYQQADAVSISAPTSAGKSYILTQIIIQETLGKKKKNIIYLVPTRALISQVEEDFRKIIRSTKELNIYLSTIPQVPEEDLDEQNTLFIFTQERLHWFMSENLDFDIDMVIVDEAQKINDSYRGILLQQKIEALIDKYPNLKIFFSCPFTSNPEILLDYLPDEKKIQIVKTDFVSVNQNLIFVTQKPRKPLEWEVNLLSNQSPILIGEIELKNRPIPDSKKLIYIVAELADPAGGNLIYANTPSQAEKIALQLYTNLTDDYDVSHDILELIKLIEKTIHKEYALANTLKKGIAFHYGNMPLIVRQEVERLFKKGDIRFLVCTSTLLEGVNLPAKSIFLTNPHRGQTTPLTHSDFWNLAGRAGRWGQEFQGNVICIQPEKWKREPETIKSKLEIEKAIETVSKDKQELINFIKKGTPRTTANSKPSLEYAVTYYYSKFLEGKIDQTYLKDDELKTTLVSEFQEYKEKIKLPEAILFRNPGISPIAQQNLFLYFQSYTGNVEDLIPVLPESDDAVDKSYKDIVDLISVYLSGDSEKLSYYHAILVVQWMNGYPLARLINRSFKYWQAHDVTKKLATVIRDTMGEVEEFVKFKFAKFSACYIDILRFHLASIERDDLISQIPQLNIWLEFGVSQQSQVSLINLGISRSSAIVLSEFIPSDKFSPKECREWLLENDYTKFDLTEIQIREIDLAIDKVSTINIENSSN